MSKILSIPGRGPGAAGQKAFTTEADMNASGKGKRGNTGDRLAAAN